MANRIETGLRIKGLSGDTNALYVLGNSFINGDVNITGNVNVIGTATTLNTQTVQTKDNRILLNYSGTNLTAIGGGIEVLSAKTDGTNVSLTTDINGDWNSNTGLNISGRTSDNTTYGLRVQNNGGTNNFVVRNDGKVGINTLNPNYQLEVLPKDLTGTTNVVIRNTSTSPNWTPVSLYVIDGSNYGTSMSTSSNGVDTILNINSGSYSYLTHSVNGSNVAELTTSGSNFLLWRLPDYFNFRRRATNGDWVSFNSLNQRVSIFNENIGGVTIPARLGLRGDSDNTSSYSLVIQNSGGTNSLIVRDDGNIGMGISTPSTKLEVIGKTKTNLLQVVSGSPQVGYVLTATDTDGNMTWQAPSSGNTSVGLNQIAFGNSINGNITSSSDFFRNSSNGYVGIGNNSPSSKLHISTSGLTGTSYSVLKIENKGDGTNYLDASIILSSGLFSNPSFDTARLYTTFDGTSIGDGRFTIQTPNESTYLFEDAFTVKNKRVGIGTNFPSERLEISGKTKTTTLQVTTNPTPGYVLTSDASGNATWQPQNTFTGGTINGPTNFTGGLSANTLVVNGVIITGFTDTNTFVTGFTYDNNNKFVISRNNGQPDLPVYINTMSGLTVNGNVTATTLNATSSLTVRGSATTRGILPETDNTYSLGSTSQRWASMYTKEVRLYESKSGSAADNDYISILAPNDLALTPNPSWSLVLPYNSGSTFNLLGVYDGSLNTSNTSWFTLSAGTNVSLNQVAFSGGSVITINSTATGGGTFTGGTVTGGSNFTGGLTANTFNTPSITLNGVTYTSFEETVKQGTGLTIHFSGKTIFNLPTSPADGNISHNLTNAKFGMIQKIYHSGSTVPTVPTEWQLVGEGTYFTYDLNIIYAEYVTNNWIEYWIIQKQI